MQVLAAWRVLVEALAKWAPHMLARVVVQVRVRWQGACLVLQASRLPGYCCMCQSCSMPSNTSWTKLLLRVFNTFNTLCWQLITMYVHLLCPRCHRPYLTARFEPRFRCSLPVLPKLVELLILTLWCWQHARHLPGHFRAHTFMSAPHCTSARP